MHAAIQRPEMLEFLLQQGADINRVSSEGTPLMVAASYGNMDSIKVLLKHGASIETADKNLSALASSLRNFSIFKLLLEYGADPNIPNGAANVLWRAITTPLREYVDEYTGGDEGNYETVKLLVDHGADIRVRGRHFNETLLHATALYGQADIAKLLIDKGLDVNVTDKRGYTPLYWSLSYDTSEFIGYMGPEKMLAKRTHNAVTQLLLDRGATLDERVSKYTPWSGNTALVSDWLDSGVLGMGVNVDKRDPYSRTPLHVAAGNGNLELIKLLLSKGADINAESEEVKWIKNPTKTTPLVYVILGNYPRSTFMEKDGNIEVVKYLLDQGADPNYRSRGKPLFHIVINSFAHSKNDAPAVAKLLLAHGVDVDVKDDDGNSALLSTYSTDLETGAMKFLVEHGANVNARYENGNTKLIYTASAATIQPELIEWLLSVGADRTIKNSEGETALDKALQNKERIVKSLDRLQTLGAVDNYEDKKNIEESIKREKEGLAKNARVIELLR